MLWYKAWRESSVRFLISAAAIASICLLRVLFERRFFPGVAHEAPGVTNYIQYLFWTVFAGGVRGLMQLSCLLLGLGGLQRDRKQGTLGFTLALPVGRVRLVASRAMVGLLQIIALSLLPALIVWAGSPVIGEHVPLSYGLGYVPFWIVGGLVTYAVAFVCSVIFQSEYVALAVSYVSYMFYLAACRHPRLGEYPLHVADFMSGRLGHALDRHTDLWTGVFPVTMVCGYVVAALAMLSLSALVTTRQDL